MLSEYEGQSAAAQVKLARYLISEADNRGLTHGEKHYLMQTALFLLHKAQDTLQGHRSTLEQHQVTELSESDIPF